ncbi:MAG: HAD family hydrolase [Prolixibacteraceae bacterium]|nr:HAD family hydrolase [Prolixibacteraceae bacterium]
MFQCIIFDVDGTLIDTEISVKKSLQKVLSEETQKEYSHADLDFILGIPGHIALEKIGIKNIQEVNRRWNEYMNDYKNQVTVFDGIEIILQELKDKSIKTGIVTSKTRNELRDDFIPFGLMKYLDFYVCADDTINHKPNPDPILKFLEISGISADQAIYIGDTIYDYKAAKAANVKFALALWGAKDSDGFGNSIQIEKPENIMTDLFNEPDNISDLT